MATRSAIFALAMGILMILVWTILLATGQQNFVDAPLETASLLAAEAITALALVIGGIGVLTRKHWSASIHIASLGMMLYTSINSIGVFAQAKVIPASIFFAILTSATIFILLVWARDYHQLRRTRMDIPGGST